MSQAIMRLNGSETAVLCPVAAFAHFIGRVKVLLREASSCPLLSSLHSSKIRLSKSVSAKYFYSLV